MTKKALNDLIRISNTVGADATLVQAGGGNTSVKTPGGKYMFIKASGTALKEMDRDRGWRRLRMDKVLELVADRELAGMEWQKREAAVTRNLLRACEDDFADTLRPSVEAHLHALLDDCVIHLHPEAVGAYVNAKEGRQQLEKLFGQERYPFLWVPYVDPGFTLAQKMAQMIDDYTREHGRKPAVIFLEKHGLFIAADTAEKALRLVKKVIRTCKRKLTEPKAAEKLPYFEDVIASMLAIRRATFEATGQYTVVRHCLNEDVTAFMKQANAVASLRSGPLTPDEMVYANNAAVWLDKCDAATLIKLFDRTVAKGLQPPKAFVVAGQGLYVVDQAHRAAATESVMQSSLNIRCHAVRFGGVATLNKRQQEFIRHWESESYRQQLNGAAAGSLRGRIAAVTGAGSGLGRSVAVGMARAGALVAVCDIDTDAAEETVGMIKAEMPDAQAIPVLCNVTDEAGVDEAFDELLAVWGGLDILVNAAGVAPAYALVDFPVDKFRFALDVNLTGYFLMARATARILKQQGMGGSIVNLSSKSGLDASKNNGAYNATKAGELHLARGWAMELGEDGIRVNSVCPGNVFEGSKIWNPEYIKVCAKKYGIKPEEVIPYYVNKTVLKREIKGQDIADAAVFLCSDQARTITGQTIVADSGQVMVR